MLQKRRRRKMIELQWAQSRVCDVISRRCQIDVPVAFLRNRTERLPRGRSLGVQGHAV
jgi:hypothetical protein